MHSTTSSPFKASSHSKQAVRRTQGANGGFSSFGLAVGNIGATWKAKADFDINIDGNGDGVLENSTNGAIYVANTDANGTFVSFGMVAAALPAEWNVVGAGDVKGTGYGDIVMQRRVSGTTWYVDLTGGTFPGFGVVTTGIGTAWAAKAVADRNGAADVIFQNTQTARTTTPTLLS